MTDTSTSIIDKQACDKTLLQIIRDFAIDYYRCFHKKQPFAIVSRKCICVVNILLTKVCL